MPRALTVGNRKQRHTPADCQVGECEHYVEMMRLRRNLHDGLGPGLAGIMMRADILAKLMTANQDAAEEMLRDLRREAAAFMTEFRRVLADQCPAELDGRDLAGALEIVASRMSQFVSVRVDVDPRASEVDRAAQVAAFWIAKEALTNVVKHARARDCEIQVRVDRGLRLTVVDNGVGGAGLGRRGVGLTSMHSRATELGGWCEIADNGFGVTVSAYLPE